jgi:hypothetical protein
VRQLATGYGIDEATSQRIWEVGHLKNADLAPVYDSQDGEQNFHN